MAHIYDGLSQFCFIGDEGWAGVNFDRTKGGVLNEDLDGEERSVRVGLEVMDTKVVLGMLQVKSESFYLICF